MCADRPTDEKGRDGPRPSPDPIPAGVDADAERERLRHVTEARAGAYGQQADAARALRQDLDDNEQERLEHLEHLREGLGEQAASPGMLDPGSILDLTSLIRRGATLEDVFQRVLERAVRLFDADKGAVLMPDGSGRRLRVGAAWSDGRPVREEFSLEIGQGVAGRVFQTGQREVIDNTARCDFFLPGEGGGDEPRYLVCIPLSVDDEVLGVLSLERDVGEWASIDTVEQLHAYGAQTAVQLRNVRVYEELLQRIEELSVLCDISRDLSSSLQHEALLEKIVHSACHLLRCGICSLMLYDEEKQQLLIQFAVGLPEEVVENARVTPGEGVAGWVAESGQPLLIEDITEDPRFRRRDGDSQRSGKYSTRSLLSVPLLIGTEVVGVLNVNNKVDNAVFTTQDRDNLTLLASHAAVSIENARLYETLQRIAVTDPLTKLYRRNYFAERLDTELGRCRRYERPLSVIMLDIDHFKRVNDTYGHQAGDMVLQSLAGLLRRYSRKDDVVARYGGEEFCSYLVETDKEGALQACERVRTAAETFPFEIGRDKPLSLTVSLGYASFPDDGDSADELIGRADLGLYAAKHGGRNQSVGYTEGLSMPEGGVASDRDE